MNYISNEQKVVVEARIKRGYDYLILSNGFCKIWKGRHTMIINGMGYDTYTGIQ